MIKKIGSWITTYNPGVVDIMSSYNFKWLTIDIEHTTISLEQTENLIQIIKKNNSSIEIITKSKTLTDEIKTKMSSEELETVESSLKNNMDWLESHQLLSIRNTRSCCVTTSGSSVGSGRGTHFSPFTLLSLREPHRPQQT